MTNLVTGGHLSPSRKRHQIATLLFLITIICLITATTAFLTVLLAPTITAARPIMLTAFGAVILLTITACMLTDS